MRAEAYAWNVKGKRVRFKNVRKVENAGAKTAAGGWYNPRRNVTQGKIGQFDGKQRTRFSL